MSSTTKKTGSGIHTKLALVIVIYLVPEFVHLIVVIVVITIITVDGSAAGAVGPIRASSARVRSSDTVVARRAGGLGDGARSSSEGARISLRATGGTRIYVVCQKISMIRISQADVLGW